MTFLEQFDFNHKTGYWSVICVAIAISLLFFSMAYMFEGVGWLSAYKDEAKDMYLDIGWNWIRGSGAAFLVAVVLISISAKLLNKNRNISNTPPLFGKLDLNKYKGLLGAIFIPVAFVFFFNGFLYRIEAAKWFYAARTGTIWYLNEASAWVTSATVMIIIGILLSAAGFILMAVEWKRQ